MANESKIQSGERKMLVRLKQGDAASFSEVLRQYRAKLKKMIRVRMNPRLQSRLDASDIVQETYVEATRSLENYLMNPELPVYIWLRELANEKLIQAHRFHLNTQKRDANREIQIYGNSLSATSEAIAIQLVAPGESPSKAAETADRKAQLVAALEQMSPLDREILTLKHFEHLTSRETSEILQIKYETVKKRYVRALEKLHNILVLKSKSSNDA